MTELAQPHDLDAEASVLSALMLDPERVAEVERIVAPDDFYADANRWVAKAIWALDGSGEKVDTTAIGSWLRAHDRLQQVGGSPYLAQLVGSTPAVAHVAAHASIVAAAARIRRVQTLCRTIVAEAQHALKDAAEWLQSVEKRVFEATDSATMAPDTISALSEAVATEHTDLLERAKSKKAPGRKTRIVQLDNILGGLVEAVPYVVGGRPGHGKTALAWQIAAGVAASGDLVAFLSQEMPTPQLTQRALAQASNVEVEKIRFARMDSKDWDSVANAVGYVAGLPIAIDDRSGHTVHSARSAVRRCVQKLRTAGHTGKLGLIAIDYLQIMGGERRDGDSRATEVSDNMKGLTRLAKEFRCPILVLSQLNRSIEKRTDKRPMMSDLGESGAIEADGYGIMFVYREDVYRPKEAHDGMAEIIVVKNRNGNTGTARLRYMPSTMFAGIADEFDEFAVDPTQDRHP